MHARDYIGKRGETIFAFLIGKKCSGRFWFHCDFLGDKAETKDFTVYLIEPSCEEATLFVQVKSTSKGYTGKGSNRKLKVNVSKKDVAKLKKVTGPAYVAGIDVELECGFLLAITKATGDRISGIPCKHPIDCALIEKLWKEAESYWAKRNMLAKKSMFS
ncbi:MAG: hypothetical protein L0Z62_11560 [Gemmataceae bacterium]|nr:hypothetical protein [Gemmataceae bacterium]